MTNGPTLPAPSPRFDIDPIRGLVCLSLVFFHLYVWSIPFRFDALWGSAIRFGVWTYRPGVESFLVLAGVLLAHSLRPAAGEQVAVGAYLKRRFWRLIVPYWIGVGLAAANYWVLQLLGKENVAPGPGEVLAQLCFVDELAGYGRNANIGYWSMVALEQFYLIWIGVFWLVTRFVSPTVQNPPKRTWGVESVMVVPTLLAGLASVAWVAYRRLELGEDNPFETPFKLGTFAMYLSGGMLLYWAVRGGFARAACVLIFLAMATLAVVAELAMPVKAILIALVLIPLLNGRKLPKVAPVRFLGWIGQRSYSIYLVHGLVVTRLPFLDGKLKTWPDWVAVPELVLGMILSVLLGLIFYRLVEQPCLRIAQRIVYRQAKPSA